MESPKVTGDMWMALNSDWNNWWNHRMWLGMTFERFAEVPSWNGCKIRKRPNRRLPRELRSSFDITLKKGRTATKIDDRLVGRDCAARRQGIERIDGEFDQRWSTTKERRSLNLEENIISDRLWASWFSYSKSDLVSTNHVHSLTHEYLDPWKISIWCN